MSTLSMGRRPRAVSTRSAAAALDPERDLAMFADQAARGRHLAGITPLGHGWRFLEGEPERAVFDLAHEPAPDAEFLARCRTAGWDYVLSAGDVHIFKAAPGTPPVRTGARTPREELLRERNRFAVLTALALLLFVAVLLGVAQAPWNPWLEMWLLVTAVLPVVHTVIVMAGFWYRGVRPPRRG